MDNLPPKRTWTYIEWVDAMGPKSHQKISKESLLDTAINCEVVCSVAGFVAHEDSNYVTIVHSVWDTMWEGEPHEDCEIGPYMKIPKDLIRNRQQINQK